MLKGERGKKFFSPCYRIGRIGVGGEKLVVPGGILGEELLRIRAPRKKRKQPVHMFGFKFNGGDGWTLIIFGLFILG